MSKFFSSLRIKGDPDVTEEGIKHDVDHGLPVTPDNASGFGK
jgi:hypothetical protein